MRSKKITSKGAITIPKDLRALTGIIESSAVDIKQVEGGVLISQHLPTCRFCGSMESVNTVMGEPVCVKCAAKMYKEIGDKYVVR